VAQIEEEESSLFLVSATIDTPFIPNQQDGVEELSLGASLDPLIERVELSEDKVFTHIGENGDNNHR
jgi:hypothetical protein